MGVICVWVCGAWLVGPTTTHLEIISSFLNNIVVVCKTTFFRVEIFLCSYNLVLNHYRDF